MYTITEIEDAIIKCLKGSTLNDYCKKIDSFQIESGDLEEQIRIFAAQLPCALIVYSGGEYSQGVGETQEKKMTFSIMVCSQSLRGIGDPRRGTIGTYKMLDDLRSVLSFNSVGLNIDELMPLRETMEINTKFFSAYSMEFETSCVLK